MNFIERWIIEKGATQMLTKLWSALSGYKTYILAGLGIVVSVAGHFWGPFQVAGQTVPQLSWGDVWQVVWQSGLFSALRAGVAKSQA